MVSLTFTKTSTAQQNLCKLRITHPVQLSWGCASLAPHMIIWQVPEPPGLVLRILLKQTTAPLSTFRFS